MLQRTLGRWPSTCSRKASPAGAQQKELPEAHNVDKYCRRAVLGAIWAFLHARVASTENPGVQQVVAPGQAHRRYDPLNGRVQACRPIMCRGRNSGRITLLEGVCRVCIGLHCIPSGACQATDGDYWILRATARSGTESSGRRETSRRAQRHHLPAAARLK